MALSTFIQLCNHDYYIVPELSITPKGNPYTLSIHSLPLVAMKQHYFIVVLMCIPQMTADVEHVSCAGWPSAYFLWSNVHSSSFSSFLIGDLVFLLLSCKCSLCILDTRPSSYTWFVNFPQSFDYLFTLNSALWCRKVWLWGWWSSM